MARKNSILFSACVVAALALAGCAGEDGALGPVGPAGGVGEAGPRGEKGDRGEDGGDGSEGSDGRDGVDGRDGRDGRDGSDGKDALARNLQFDDVGFPWTNAEKHQARASSAVTIGGVRHAIGYDVILRGGQDPTRPDMACDLESSPETCFGVIVDADYEPILDDNGEPFVSAATDFVSLLNVEGSLFSVAHFESNPAGLYLTKVAQAADGELSAEWTRAIDVSSIDGVWTTCAGSVTPWGTHLASEEYPPDARPIEQAMVDFATYDASGVKGSVTPVAKFKNHFPLTAANFKSFKSDYSPYMHGYPVEVTVDAAGEPTLEKHYAMGRTALELAYVMPDDRTAYLTDDGGNVGLFMFVADTPGNLSAGRLYAARLYQTTAPGGELHADVQWIDLGHATNGEIAAHIDPPTGEPTEFSDIFEYQDAAADGTCAAGFRPVRANSSTIQCLKLVPGMEMAASRLETRRYAGYLGATIEFNKEEGITFDPDRNRLYLAMSDVTGSMGPQSVIDHIDVAPNRCGVVYALDVAPLVDLDGALVSEYAAQNIYPFVNGVETSYPSDSPYAGNSCSVNGIANPDNVTYLPGYDTLVIGEDTSKHVNDAIWAVNVVDRKMTRIFTTPYGSETTSPYWFPALNGHGYLMSVIQHPYGEGDDSGVHPRDRLVDAEATGSRSWMGVLGPFPSLSLD